MKKRKITFILVYFMAVALFSIGFTSYSMHIYDAEIASAETVSNKKVGWGIRRNSKHEQPDVGAENRKVLEENGGICLGDKEKKYVYLTFDSGYEAGYTKTILEALKKNDVSATFFITAHYLNSQPELVRQMIDEGHIVGNHTVNHKSMPTLTEEQIKKEVMEMHQAVYEKFGYEMKYIRPPMGEYSERTLKVCNSLGYKTVMWSFAYVDWNEDKQPAEDEAKKIILDNLHNGEVILLHGTSKTNANILDGVLQEIKAQGYEIRSLEEFV